MWIFVPIQNFVGKFLGSFKAFPPERGSLLSIDECSRPLNRRPRRQEDRIADCGLRMSKRRFGSLKSTIRNQGLAGDSSKRCAGLGSRTFEVYGCGIRPALAESLYISPVGKTKISRLFTPTIKSMLRCLMRWRMPENCLCVQAGFHGMLSADRRGNGLKDSGTDVAANLAPPSHPH
jgi:hypothetical protein